MKPDAAVSQGAMEAFVCPDCRAPLADLRCARCGHQYERAGGFPILLSKDASLRIFEEVAKTYDAIYTQHANVWEGQGRTREFVRYFARLLGAFPARRFLEIGCGEGAVLGAVAAEEKFGTDLSVQALGKAASLGPSRLCVALGERLPFPDRRFDLIASVGVMEHFLDPDGASREIFRVLDGGGRYVALIHVRMTAWQSLRQKVAEYVFPRPKPIGLARWFVNRLFRPVRQPIQNGFTIDGARACLERSGFHVTDVIHKATAADAPLIGPHVVIYVCRKPD